MKRTLFLDIDYRLQTVLQTVFVIVITTLTQLAVVTELVPVAVVVPAADSLELTVLVPLTSLSREICDDLSERFPISRLSLPSSFSFSHFFASPDLSSCSERNILSFNQTGTVGLTVHTVHTTQYPAIFTLLKITELTVCHSQEEEWQTWIIVKSRNI